MVLMIFFVLLTFFIQEIMFFFSTFDIASQVSQAHRVSAALSGGRGELLGAFCFPDKEIDLMMKF